MTKNKIISVLTLFLILFIAVGAASAATDSDIIANDVNGDNGLSEPISNEISDNGTFTDLQNNVSAAIAGSNILDLQSDYVYNQTSDSLLSEGVVISSDLTINGNNHIIDGADLARIFKVNSGTTVTIKNVVFTNGNNVSGGAIYNLGNLNIDNCSFIENCKYYTDTATQIYGGAIYSGASSTLTVTNSVFRGNGKGSTFTNAQEKVEAGTINGGAISAVNATKVVIDNTLFDENLGRWGSACHFINSAVDFKNNNVTNSEVYDGAIYLNGNVNITNCKFINNNAKFVGSSGSIASGADICIMVYDDITTNIVVDDCTFTNSKVTSSNPGAGSVHIQSNLNTLSTVTIKNSKFTNVSSTKYGAIYSINSSLVLDNVSFEKCAATSGGAIYASKSVLNVTDCNFTSCNATSGGAIYTLSIKTCNITGCEFENCTAKNGGAINGASNVTYCNFTSCSATTNGGAINDVSSVTYCNFTSCNATTKGGAIYTYNSVLNVTYCNFTSCSASSGGAIYNYNNGVLNIVTDCKFIGCNATKGGAIYNNPWYSTGALNVIDCEFKDCNASNGGAIYTSVGSTLTIDDCTFVNNKATVAGGAIYALGKVTVTDSTFNDNIANGGATFGGALYLAGAESRVDNCDFDSNAAGTSWVDNEDTYGGGSIYITATDCTVSNSRFTNSKGYTSRNGAGIYVNSTNAKVTNCNFTDLIAGLFGGVLANNNSAGFEITDCLFKNIVGNNGGGLVVKADSTIDNCTFDNCAACFGNAILVGKAYHGSAIVAFSATINDCTFINCHSSGIGSDLANGAIDFQTQVVSAVISGTTIFENCSATDRSGYGTGGAAIYSSSGNLTIKGTLNIKDCSCNYADSGENAYGGAIANYGVMNIEAETSIVNCSADYGGAIFNAYYGNGYPGVVNITGKLTIANCSANKDGGAIYNVNWGDNALNGNVTITNAKITNCNATEKGGVIYNDGVLSVNNCIFTENNKNGTGITGGVIYSNTGSSLTVNNSVFTRNCINAYYTDGNGQVQAQSIEGGAIGSVDATVIIENTLFDNNTARWGSALNLASGNAQITNCNITNSNVYNGAFYINGNVNITNCKFENNEAKFVGSKGCLASGADIIIMSYDGIVANVNIDGCSFDHSKVTSSVAGAGSVHAQVHTQGGVSIDLTIKNSNFTNIISPQFGAMKLDKATTTMDNVRFENCTAGTTGGAIYVNEGTLSVDKSTFVNNKASVAGGAIYALGKVTVTDSTFNDNLANGGKTFGGALYLAGAESSVNNCDFDSNAAGTVWVDNEGTYGGGSIYITATDCTVSNSRFTNSKGYTSRNGAGISVNATNAEVTNCNFTDLKAGLFAGGIYVNLNANGFEVSDCVFKNVYGSNGGALTVEANSNIDNCTFDNCAADFGNAILAGIGYFGTVPADYSLTINDCSFTNCHSDGDSSNLANGAVDIQDQVIAAVISGTTTFENCSVTHKDIWGTGGGAIYSKSGNLTITGTLNINNCVANSTNSVIAKGGAIVNKGTMNIEAELNINNCSAEQGGAIYNEGTLTISDAKITNCIASTGSVISLASGSTTTFTNVEFENNTAKGGSLIDADNCVLTITDSSFVDNVAVDGIVIDIENTTSNLNVTGSTFTSNDKYVVPSNGIANGDEDVDGVITSEATSYLANNNFTDNENDVVLSNLDGANATIGVGNTVDDGSYIVNNGTLNGASAVLGEPLVATQINDNNESVEVVTLTANIFTDSGNILVVDNNVATATVECDNGETYTLNGDGAGTYSGSNTFTANDGIKLYGDELTIEGYGTDNGNILPTSAPDGSLAQLKEIIDAWNSSAGNLVLSGSFAYNDTSDSEITTIVLNKSITIVGNDVVISTDDSPVMTSLFTMDSDVDVSISGVGFVSSVPDITVNDGTLTVADCSSTNTNNSIYLVSGTVKDMVAIVNDNSTIITGVDQNIGLTAMVTAGGLSVYNKDFNLTIGDEEFSTDYVDGNYTATGIVTENGVYTASINGVSNVSTATVVALGASYFTVSDANCTHGDKVNVTVCLEYAVPDDYVIVLYVNAVNTVNTTFANFVNVSGKYYYNFTVATAGISEEVIPLYAQLLNSDNKFIATSNYAYLTLSGADPEIEAISVSGNYSTKVNITVKVTKGNVTGDMVVLHLIDGDNVTAEVADNGTATFTDVVLTKAGNYTTKVVYTRSYGSGYYYLATANVTWNISKISTNVTFDSEIITASVNQTSSVNVTVKDYYNNTVKSGQINVTDENIILVDGTGNLYNGTVYNLTNGSVTVYFKYLGEGTYHPKFSYSNANSTYSNNNNYYYSNANVTVVIEKANVTVTVDEDSRNVTGRVYDNITIKGSVVDVTGVVPVGNVTIKINGTDYNATVGADGTFTIVVNASAAFEGSAIPVSFISGNTTMWKDTESITPNLVDINITLISTNVTVNPVTYTKNAGEAFNITGNVTTINSTIVPTGKVAIVINGTTYDAYLNADGTYSIPVTVNNSGTWNNLNVTFTSNNTGVLANNASGNIVNVTINKLDTVINITDVPAEYVVNVNETFIINGTVTASNGENAAGNVTITVNGQNFTADVVDGVFHLNVNSTVGLDKAAYNITFTSNNVTRWNNCIGENIVNITVNKLNTTIELDDEIVVVVINQTYYINGTVTDANGKGVAGNVTVTVNGVPMTVATDADGNFSISNSSATPFGPLNCTVSFADFNASVYNAPANAYVNVTVLALNTTVNIISVSPESGSVYVGQTITIAGNVTDDYYNKAVSGVVVSITVNGKEFNDTTGDDGSFSIAVTSDKAISKNIYVVSGSLTSEVYNTPKSANVSLEFKKLPTVVTVDNTTYTGKVNSTITITGTVNDTVYNKAANGTVFLTLNGKEFNTTVGADGKFSLDVSCNVSGTYKKLTVRYVTNNTDVWENNVSSKITIKVEVLNVYIISNYDLDSAYNASFNRLRNYTFNVTDELGNKVQNGTLKLYLRNGTINQTVSNGQATFKNILFNDTGSYGFMLDYIGNKFYNSASNATKIIVAKVATTIYINGSINKDSKVLNITVKDDIDNKTVIKGTIYYVTPDGQGHEIILTNGSAQVTVVANRTGEYDIAVSYYDLEQDYLYSTEDFKYNITVAGIDSTFKGKTDPANGELIENTLLITSTVRDDNGNLIEDGVMNYCVGGNYYTADVVNGVATLEVSDFNGPVMVIAQFDGVDCTQPQEVYVVEPSFGTGNLVTVVA